LYAVAIASKESLDESLDGAVDFACYCPGIPGPGWHVCAATLRRTLGIARRRLVGAQMTITDDQLSRIAAHLRECD
jgi:hypothetical protein